MKPPPADTPRGRATGVNPDVRFAHWRRQAEDDGWPRDALDEGTPPPATELIVDHTKSVIATNDSPDIPFRHSVNPYRGCEHGCIYCFARPSHAYLGLSPGLDFERRIVYKPEAAQKLKAELARPGYQCDPMALGTNTDLWQPVDRDLQLARGTLEVLSESDHPATIITKGALILRDIDLLAAMAERQLVHVTLSITTLDATLARTMEPRAASPKRRLEVVQALSEAGVPTGVSLGPVIPALNDRDMESILESARIAGASFASWLLVRLPGEVAPLFTDWLQRHYPDRATRVLNLLRQMHGGQIADARFGHRMRGEGPLAKLLSDRFRLATTRLGYRDAPALRTDQFKPPRPSTAQLQLF